MSLAIHSIDLHYHAGQERTPGVSMRDYLEHAVITGRSILGLTDHLNLYQKESRRSSSFPYRQDLQGLSDYREEVERLKPEFSSLKLFFTPEIPSRWPLEDIPPETAALSDGFICEFPYRGKSIDENTDAFVDRIAEARAFSEQWGKPLFIAHPFRNAVNMRLVKSSTIDSWVTDTTSRPDATFPQEALYNFFLLDLARIGEAAAAHGIPLEINGNTDARVRASNLPGVVHMMWAAYKALQAAGASFVPGSDQHSFTRSTRDHRMGGYVPFETFDRLGIGPNDIAYLDRLRPSPAGLHLLTQARPTDTPPRPNQPQEG